MALVKDTIYFNLKVSDGQPSPTFTKTCLVNSSLGLQISKALAARVQRDCDVQNLAGWQKNSVTGLSWSLSGEGLLPTDLVEDAFNWSKDTKAREIQLEIYETL